MWQGVTEGNLERVLNLLKAMSPIAVIVDEADAQLAIAPVPATVASATASSPKSPLSWATPSCAAK